MRWSSLIPAAGMLLGACSNERPTEERPSAPVSVHVIKSHSATHGALIPATLESVKHATISTRIPARVKRVHVHEGQEVTSGTVLVSLSDNDLEAQLSSSKVSLASADAQLGRLERLIRSGAATRSELEVAQALRAQAFTAVQGAEEALHYTQLRAPFDGRVKTKHVTEGDMVTAGAPLVELEGPGLELVAHLASDDVERIALGQVLSFETGSGKGEARVSSIAPSADPVAHRVEIRAQVTHAVPGLLAGSFARLALGASAAIASELWVASSALVQRGDLRGVFVARNGHAELRWLLLGDSVGEAAPVQAGLTSDEVVVDRPGSLRDGQMITVVHEN